MKAKTSFILPLLLLALTACQTESATSPEADNSQDPALGKFIGMVVEKSQKSGYQFESRMQFPAVWLFNKDGKLVAQLTEASPLPQDLPAAASNAMPISLLQESWTALSPQPFPAFEQGKEVAVFISTFKTGCESNDTCTKVKQRFDELQSGALGVPGITLYVAPK